jgi:hypothetical protein
VISWQLAVAATLPTFSTTETLLLKIRDQSFSSQFNKINKTINIAHYLKPNIIRKQIEND